MTIDSRYQQIGLDRLVRLHWLGRTAYLVLAGNEKPIIKRTLYEELGGAFHTSASTKRGSLDKTITILMKIWMNVPRELRAFHNDALNLLRDLSRKDHIAVHWGMVMSVYPFWAAVATQVGRLLRLQGTAAANQVQRRLREQYGERETVSRRTRYVIRSFVDWKVLSETSEKGIYMPGKIVDVHDSRLISWIIEASILARANGGAAFKDLLEGPDIFPFKLAHISAEQVTSIATRLDVLRHGLDDDLLMLRRE